MNGPGFDRPVPLGTGALAMFGPFLICCKICGVPLLVKGGRPSDEEPSVLLHAEWHGRNDLDQVSP